jgi:hypothetical protein
MHGFSLFSDKQNGHFYSWRCEWDHERVCKKYFGNHWEFTKKTGLAFRNGYAVWAVLNGFLKNNKKLGTLSTLLLNIAGNWNQTCDISMVQSQGLFDIECENYIKHVDPLYRSQLPEINQSLDQNLIGEFIIDQKTIPVFGGIGDLIATLDGLFFGNANSNTLVVNSGTGSQIALIDNGQDHPSVMGGLFERRRGNLYNYYVLSHIPCGRALDYFKKIALGIFPDKSEADFWKLFNSQKIKNNSDETSNLFPKFNFGIFDSASYGKPGAISNLKDSQSFEYFIYGLFVSLIDQYEKILNTVIPKPNYLIFSGGIFERNPNISKIITERLGCENKSVLRKLDGPNAGLSALSAIKSTF